MDLWNWISRTPVNKRINDMRELIKDDKLIDAYKIALASGEITKDQIYNALANNQITLIEYSAIIFQEK